MHTHRETHLVVLMALCWVMCTYPQSVRAAEESIEARVERLLAEEGRVLAALDELDRKVSELSELKESLLVQQRALQGELDTANRILEDASRDMHGTQSRLRKRLRIRSNLNLEQAHWRQLLFADGSQNDWMRRRGYLASIVRSDLKLIRRYRELDREMRVLVDRRQKALDAVRDKTATMELKTQEYLEEKALREAALTTLRERQSLLRTVLIQQAERRRSLRLASAAGGGIKGDGILRQRGLLIHPTPHRIVRKFGMIKDLETGTSLQSNGWTYRGPMGSPIQAVFSGLVVYSGWYMGFGQLLMIDHGQGHHTLYAHLDRVRKVKGDRVEQGDLIGHLGDTGSLRGPQLYFEFRQNRKPDDPARWLLRRP